MADGVMNVASRAIAICWQAAVAAAELGLVALTDGEMHTATVNKMLLSATADGESFWSSLTAHISCTAVDLRSSNIRRVYTYEFRLCEIKHSACRWCSRHEARRNRAMLCINPFPINVVVKKRKTAYAFIGAPVNFYRATLCVARS